MVLLDKTFQHFVPTPLMFTPKLKKIEASGRCYSLSKFRGFWRHKGLTGVRKCKLI